MEAESDAAAIGASLDDPARFGVVFDRHATVLFRYLVSRIGPEAAEAVLGDVFRIAFERRAAFDTSRPDARPWLYGIATKLIARHRRSEARRLRATARFRALPLVHEDPVERATEIVDAVRLWPEVASAVADLPAGERDALLLFAWEGLDYADIAAALAIPVGTVRSRLNRARTKLRELAPVVGEERATRTAAPESADPALFKTERKRLMSTIASESGAKERVPYPRMYPRLAYTDEVAALEYLTRVFGFVERREARMGTGVGDDHMLAWLEFGDGIVMIGHANHDIHRIYSPAEVGHSTSMINVDVHDIDTHYAHSVAEGAEITMELSDAFYGERRYEATDLEGHRWHFGESLAAIRARGGDAPQV